MSVKDVKECYAKVSQQYSDMLNEIRDFEQECERGLFEPERLDMIKESIQPLKDNYERWSYMMFLLNQPNRKQKVNKYKKQQQSKLNKLSVKNSIESTFKENDSAIKKTDEVIYINENKRIIK